MVRDISSLLELARNFLVSQRNGEDSSQFLKELEILSIEDLSRLLSKDGQKKAFWINLYNSFVQDFFSGKVPGDGKKRILFSKRNLNIAGQFFSLDDIEHSILRRSKMKYAMGYFHKIRVTSQEKMLRVEKLDYRIHFALNCGARSCPPIGFYNWDEIDFQLDLATRSYLSEEVKFLEKEGIVKVPAILKWYQGDFGGPEGIKELLKKYGIIPLEASPRVRFLAYDWGLKAKNFVNLKPYNG